MDTLAAGSNDMEITAGAIDGSGGEGTELPAAGDASPSAESDASRKISEARNEYSNASLEVLRIENEIGSLKRELKDAKETADALGLRLQMLLDGEGDDSDTPASSAETSGEEPAATPNDWRAVPLENVIGKIKGLGKKKLDAILCITPTLGAFEDLRAECGEYGGLFGKMPEGVGKGMCSKLEDAAIAWLAEYWKTAGDAPSDAVATGDMTEAEPAPAAEQAEPSEPEQVAEEPAQEPADETPDESPDDPAEAEEQPEAAPIAEAEPVAPVAEDSTTPQAPESSPTELLIELAARRDEVIGKYLQPWIDSAPFTNIYDEGREDFIAGRSLADCPWQPGLQQDSWLLGFQFESDRAVPAFTDESDESPDDAPDSADESDGDDLADLI